MVGSIANSLSRLVPEPNLAALREEFERKRRVREPNLAALREEFERKRRVREQTRECYLRLIGNLSTKGRLLISTSLVS